MCSSMLGSMLGSWCVYNAKRERTAYAAHAGQCRLGGVTAGVGAVRIAHGADGAGRRAHCIYTQPSR